MATITNRSNYLVSVARHPELARNFAYSAQSDISAYVKQLGEQGFKPVIRQLEDKLQVRIRRVGHADQLITFKSAAEADSHIKRIESEQTQGLFIDYTAAANVTFAELIQLGLRLSLPVHLLLLSVSGYLSGETRTVVCLPW